MRRAVRKDETSRRATPATSDPTEAGEHAYFCRGVGLDQTRRQSEVPVDIPNVIPRHPVQDEGDESVPHRRGRDPNEGRSDPTAQEARQ